MTLNIFLDYLLQHFNYSRQCINLPLNTINCSVFWGITFSIASFLTFLLFVSLIRLVLRDRAQFKAYQKRMIERAKIADPEVMKKAQWQADYDFGDIDTDVLAEKMRQQLNNKR
jgi:predicted membrane protein